MEEMNKEEKIRSITENIQDMAVTIVKDRELLYSDGAGWDGKRSAYSVKSEEGLYFEVFNEEWTNNEMEYMGLIHALAIASHSKQATVYCDSQLIVNQMNGTYKVINQTLFLLYKIAKLLQGSTNIIWVPREENKAGIALDKKMWALRGKI